MMVGERKVWRAPSSVLAKTIFYAVTRCTSSILESQVEEQKRISGKGWCKRCFYFGPGGIIRHASKPPVNKNIPNAIQSWRFLWLWKCLSSNFLSSNMFSPPLYVLPNTIYLGSDKNIHLLHLLSLPLSILSEIWWLLRHVSWSSDATTSSLCSPWNW